ncbi:hypothetical protein WJX72_008177 [[Myrmecia] bisecta]|uniref:Uncharacterized protein n=1 Tax=[Myrmecia] bisecta TaxID=41462 RepID=A0AAW1PUS3_9CHLO
MRLTQQARPLQGAPLRMTSMPQRSVAMHRPAFRAQQRPSSLRCVASTSAHAAQHGQHSSRVSLPAALQPLQALANSLTAVWTTAVERLGQAVQAALPAPEQIDSQALQAQIKYAYKHVRVMAAVAPFAVTTGSTNTFLLITKTVGQFIKLYLLLLFLRVLLSWFPAFNWERQPWLALRQVTDPYLNLFRGLVPPLLGTIDFTPLFGFLILQFLAGALDVGADDDIW